MRLSLIPNFPFPQLRGNLGARSVSRGDSQTSTRRDTSVGRTYGRGLTGNHESGVRGTFHGVTGDVVHGAAPVGRVSIGGGHREDEQLSGG